MKLFSITSDLHSEMMAQAIDEPFIIGIEKAAGEKFTPENDFSKYNAVDSIIYVRTGGTEGVFKSIFFESGQAELSKDTEVRLLASGQSNSLAASMEILSFLNNNGIPGRIIHGSSEHIASILNAQSENSGENIVKTFDRQGILKGKRYGAIGRPSDWLISSQVDYSKAKKVLGCELVDIDINELSDKVKQIQEHEIHGKLPAINESKFGRNITKADFSMANDIYFALKDIIREYKLDGITLRCFDLLTSLGNTGCLGLAILNAEGFIASCEGDIPTMLSMAIVREMTGESGFQVNLSRIDSDKFLFAHCTAPLSMLKNYCYDTHFESGIGVAIHGEFDTTRKSGIFKLGADLEHCINEEVSLVSNQYEDNLCRTQIWVKAAGLDKYLLVTPLGNHHVIYQY